MLSVPGRSAARRIASVRHALPTRTAIHVQRTARAPLALQLSPTVFHRSYARGAAQPPGGTHRMNLGGEPEKPALEQYGVDLTAKAKSGKLDPVIGRDQEIHRTIQILSRRTKNNPVLIGAAGTGKYETKSWLCTAS